MKNRILISITCIAAILFILSCGCVQSIEGDISWPAVIGMGVSLTWLLLFFDANGKSA